MGTRTRLDSTSTALFSVTNDQRPSAVATTPKGFPGTGTAAWETARRTGAAATAVSQLLPARTLEPFAPAAELPHPQSAPAANSSTRPVRHLTCRSLAGTGAPVQPPSSCQPNDRPERSRLPDASRWAVLSRWCGESVWLVREPAHTYSRRRIQARVAHPHQAPPVRAQPDVRAIHWQMPQVR